MAPPSKTWPARLGCLILPLLLAVTARVNAEHLPIKVYTSADGLGSGFVNSLMRDSRGFLWICTRDGLTRFDGAHFVTYQVGDGSAPPGIEQILEAPNGIYWIETTAGLYRFDPRVASPAQSGKDGDHAILNAQLVSNERGVFYKDRSGNLFAISDKLKRWKEEDGKPVFEEIDLNVPSSLATVAGMNNILEARDQSLWLTTLWGIIRRFADGKEVLYRSGNGVTYLRGLVEDDAGRIWVGAADSVYVIFPESERELGPISQPLMRDLKTAREASRSQTPISLPMKPGEIKKYSTPNAGAGDFLYRAIDGHIWVSNQSGVSEFDGQSFHVFTTVDGFIDVITQGAEDESGNLWLGGANGLMRLDRGGLTSYSSRDGIGNPNIVVVNETRDGKLYSMGRDLSLSFFDGRSFQTIRLQIPANADILWTANPAYQDSNGEWWLATTLGLYHFAATNDIQDLARRQPIAVYDSRNGLKSSQVFHIWEDTHHDLWISTRLSKPQDFGLTKWTRGTQQLRTFTPADGLPDNRIASAFTDDRNGNVWVGFYDGGLARYSGGRFTEITTKDGAPGGLITALHKDRNDRIWIASSQNGLSRMDDPSAQKPVFVNFTTRNGLSSNNVRSITEDLRGDIYAGTARGLDRLSADATHVKHYSTNDGLAGDWVSTSFCDHSGVLWFGTPNGLSRLNPSLPSVDSAPSILINAVRVAGERRPISDLGSVQLPLNELSYRQNNLQIDFFSIEFAAGESLRYQYKLEGGDSDWSAPTDQRSVTFANLQPGTYRFLVRAVNAEGIASETPAVVTFRILAPLWLRWWFIVLAVLVIAAALFLLYRYRMARMREVNAALSDAKFAEEKLRKTQEERLVELERVRRRIATDLHDDIGSSLTRISLLSEVAQRKGHNDASDNGSLSTIAGLSRELVDSMSDIVWAINPERDSLGDLTQRMRHFAADVFSACGIDFRLNFPDFDRDVKLGANFRRELFLIFKEAVNNCVKHSACTEAQIEFRLEGDRKVFLKLADNGRGFDVSSKSSGHGLSSMRARAEGLGGRLEIESRPNDGTSLRFEIPLSVQAGAMAP